MSKSIIQLLSFLDDVQPAPLSHDQTAPGPGPMRKELCANCNGTGFVRRFNNRPCVRCGGRIDPIVKGRGWVWFDDYTEAEVGHEETTITDHRIREITCWTCGGLGVHPSGKRCVWCVGTGKRRLPPVEPHVDQLQEDATIAALQATRSGEAVGLRRRGSFDTLELGLLDLSARGRFLVISIYVSGGDREELSEKDNNLLTSSIRDLRVFVESREGRVRVPLEIRRWFDERGGGGRVPRGPHANGFAVGRRNNQIKDLATTNPTWSHARIAERIGVNRSTVSRVLAALARTSGERAGQPPGPATVGSGEPREEAR